MEVYGHLRFLKRLLGLRGQSVRKFDCAIQNLLFRNGEIREPEFNTLRRWNSIAGQEVVLRFEDAHHEWPSCGAPVAGHKPDAHVSIRHKRVV
jgi:hypothetical protein